MNKRELMKQKMQRQQQIVDTAKEGKRSLTAEEQVEYEGLQKDIESLQREIEQDEGGENESQSSVEDERSRSLEITKLCREFSIPNNMQDDFIESGKTVDQVRAAILDEMRNNGAPIQSRGIADVTKDENDKFRDAAADALVLRGGVNLEKSSDGARELMGLSLRDLAIECLQKETGETGLHRKNSDDVLKMLQRQYFNPTAAFPTILDTAINKAYVEGHRTVAVTFDKWTKKGVLKDFKTHDNNYLAGPAGEFLEVPEGGELKHDRPTDQKMPTRKLKTYGRQFTMTREAFINDDIDFLSKIPSKYAASARKTINKQVYQILVNNPATYDGTALFSNLHKNLIATGTGITQESVQKMFMALQLQTDQFGEAIIIRPAYIIVPIGYSFDMYALFESPTIHTSGNTQAANPLYRYRSVIEVVEDPTLNVLVKGGKMPWFVVGDKADTDSIEVDYLNGQEVPTIRRMEAPGTLGFIWDIYLDWGINVMDYRGLIKNPGIELSTSL